MARRSEASQRRSLHAAVLCAVSVLLVSCGPKSTGEPESDSTSDTEQIPLVRTAAVELRNVQRVIEVSTSLESRRTIVVQPKISGRVMPFTPGELDAGVRVTAGQKLITLDDREAVAAKRQIELQLEDRKVRLELQKVEKDSRQRKIEQARIERDRLKKVVDRNNSIDPELLSPQEVEQDQYAYEAAVEALKVAELDLRKQALEIDAAAHAIDELKARIEQETLKIQEHTILAPISGVISERNVEEGQTVTPTTDLFTIVDDNDLVAYLRRPQRELPLVSGAKKVTFTTEAVPGVDFDAEIEALLPVVDSETGTFQLRIRVPRDPEGESALLRPGLFIRAQILTEQEREALMVPKTAVINDGLRSIVFAVRDGIAQRVVLKKGFEERDFIESTDRGGDGLQPEDRVIVSGQNGLRDNAAVEVSDSE